MHVSPEFIAASLVLAFAGLERYTSLLDRFKKKSSADAAGELDIADRKIDRLERELAEWKANTPLFELLAKNTETQLQILERLAHHNGSFKHVEEALGHIDDSFKVMTGFICSLVELPLKPPVRR